MELLLIIPHSTTGFMISTTTNSSTVPNTKNSDIKRYQPSELSLDPVGLSDYIKKCHDNTDAILSFLIHDFENESGVKKKEGNRLHEVFLVYDSFIRNFATYHFLQEHVCKGKKKCNDQWHPSRNGCKGYNKTEKRSEYNNSTGNIVLINVGL